MSEKDQAIGRLRVLRIIWVQQLFTLVILGLIGHFVTQGEEPVTDQLLTYGAGCLVVAVSSIAFGIYLRLHYAGTVALPLLMPSNPTPWKRDLTPEQVVQIQAEANNVYKTVTIAGTAFAELAAVAGVVLAVLIKMPILYVPFGGLAGVFILWQVPNSGSFEAVCGALVQKKRDQASA